MNNNKNGFLSVTNNQIHLIHQITDNLCKSNQLKDGSKGFAKNNLHFKNNKNLIYSQNLSKADSKGDKFEREDSVLPNVAFESCENKLKGINQCKSVFHAKRFIMTNVAEKWDNLLSFKLKLVKQDDCIESNDPNSDDKALNAIESTPSNLVCQNGHSRPLESAERFVKGSSINEHSSDTTTMKINYFSRQFSGLTNVISSNSHAKNGNSFHDSGLHEKTESATNEKTIPNIVINGSAADSNDKLVNGVAKQATTSMGK